MSSVNNTESASHRFCRIFNKHASKASMNGVIFIVKSHHPLASLFSNFFLYQIYSKVNLRFDNLPFPAVTVCSVNMMRFSKRMEASEKIQNLFVRGDNVIRPVGRAANVTCYNTGTNDSETQMFCSKNNVGKLMAEPNFWDNGLLQWAKDRDAALCQSIPRASVKFFLSLQSIHKASVKTFHSPIVYCDSFQNLREELGHQLTDFIRMCSFNERSCGYSFFQTVVTPEHGNCFTLHNPDFVAIRSGQNTGVELILNLETEEYVKAVTSAKGARVIIHEPVNTNHPYSNPTTPLPPSQYCQHQCQGDRIKAKCKCFDYQLYLNDVTDDNSSTKLTQCTSQEEQRCLYEVRCQLEKDKRACDCKSPCREVRYQKTIAHLQWPETGYLEYIRKDLCESRNPPKICSRKHLTLSDFGQQLIKVSIFFEDLHYEELTDQPNYEFTNLLSGIGGSIGLWIGLSVLSLFEIVHLILEVFRYVVCRKWRQN
ncbi:amiloride-sensitive sodium channel subunit alpha-like [Physella acuta]|uniref:amiloride-sensitive sodium channel subunit alpha-like n=1 Tax=Physella acuta TaxID=109671 RepID=UPI0027DCC1C8|nr:amiloride-sensitive sodium channel subunit alpha-like [Physella acuta]